MIWPTRLLEARKAAKAMRVEMEKQMADQVHMYEQVKADLAPYAPTCHKTQEGVNSTRVQPHRQT